MTLQQLQYFKKMASTLHYTKAASQLHISQPSLSYSLSQLEMELEVPLFNKVGKQVFLTIYGEEFLKTVDSVLCELNSGIDRIRNQHKNTKEEIRLGYIQSISSTFIPHMIEQYYIHQGDDSTQFVFVPNQQYDLKDSLKTNKLDVVVGTNYCEQNYCQQIATQELVLISPKSHQFAAIGSIAFKELEKEPMVMLMQKTGLYHSVRDLFKKQGIPLNIAQEACDYNAAINYVSMGKGLSLLPYSVAIGHSNIAVVRIRDVVCERPIYLTWNEGAMCKKTTKNFIEFVCGYYSKK